MAAAFSRHCSADKRCTASGCTSERVRRVSDLREDTGGPQPPPVAPGLKGRDNRADEKRKTKTTNRRSREATEKRKCLLPPLPLRLLFKSSVF